MNLHYETHGAGEPLLLIPGFASGAWNWFRQIDDLSKNFKVITFDPHGIGRSKAKNEADLADLSMQAFADDVLHILDELDIEKAHILGASFGGFVAETFALNFPDRLEKLILACTSFGGAQHVPPDLEVLMAFASTDGMNTTERIRKFMIPAFTPEFTANFPEIVEKVCELRENSIVPERVYMAQLTAATTFDYEVRMNEIKNETLIITGDKDKVVPMQNSINLAEKMPNARLEIIKNGSHMFFVENADEFNRKVKEFILSND
ncbi:MAG: alpha/beta hydrolase [Pyrinomonadaceae bacterium]|nr:alpha/beta hydrolase [Pyrinomonadaceae bacterium]